MVDAFSTFPYPANFLIATFFKYRWSIYALGDTKWLSEDIDVILVGHLELNQLQTRISMLTRRSTMSSGFLGSADRLASNFADYPTNAKQIASLNSIRRL